MNMKIIASLLKLSRLGSTSIDMLNTYSPFTNHVIEKSLKELTLEGFVKIRDGLIEISSEQRVRMAYMTMRQGMDLRSICEHLRWSEFEDICVLALEENGFDTRKHIRFKHHDKRREIDIIGFKEPYILSVECKHWKKSWQNKATRKFVETHKEKTMALLENIEILMVRIDEWKEVSLIPIVITLSETPFRIYEGVPVVPIFFIRDFLHELPKYITFII